MTKRKSKDIQVRLDEDLYADAKEYVKANKISLGGLIRALLRIQVDPRDPRDPPPGIEEEKRRPSRRKKRATDEEE